MTNENIGIGCYTKLHILFFIVRFKISTYLVFNKQVSGKRKIELLRVGFKTDESV